MSTPNKYAWDKTLRKFVVSNDKKPTAAKKPRQPRQPKPPPIREENPQIKAILKNPTPTPETVKFLHAAAALYIQGIRKREIEKQLGFCESYFRTATGAYRELWQQCLVNCMDAAVAKVQADAGTDAILEDPAQHFELAKRAETWLGDRGKTLFPESAKMTLTRFYYEHYEPQFLFESPANSKKDYITILRKWVYFTGNPPIEEITNELFCKFRDALLKMRGKKGLKISPMTVRSQMKRVQTLLDKLGPRGRNNREALGLLKDVPYARPPRPDYKIPRTVAEEQITACYEAAACMDVPWSEGIKPPAWWKALLVLSWNSGLRTGTLLSMRMSEIEWKLHRLVLPSRRMKSRRPLIVHLNETVLDHLRRIRSDRELVFPWPGNRRMFWKNFHKLQTIAGIPEDQHFGLHTIRKTLATRLWEQSPAAAQYALGHTGMDVTRQHYVDGGPIVARALDALPQPNVFIMGSKQ